MENQEILAKVKDFLRRSHSKLDGEIMDDIAAALADMQGRGVSAPDIDATVLKAIKLYAKAGAVSDAKEGTEWMDRYNKLVDHMMMTGRYRQGGGCDD